MSTVDFIKGESLTTYLKPVICIVIFDSEYVVIDRKEITVSSHEMSKM